MMVITKVGVPLMVLAVAVQWWVQNDRPRIRFIALSAGLSFLLGLGLNQIILLFVQRIRPYDAGVTHLIIEKSADWSFPSDHATASIAIVTAFAMQGLPRRALCLSLLAFVICWSRIYVGMHYVTDILGGAATGVLAGVAVRYLYRATSRLNQFATRIL
jgi:undecaprenyl-diphosphatase